MGVKFVDTHDYIVGSILEQLQLESAGLIETQQSFYISGDGYSSFSVVTIPRLRTIQNGKFATKSPQGRKSRIPCIHSLRRLIELLLKAGITAFDVFESGSANAQSNELNERLGRTCNCIMDTPLKPAKIAEIIEGLPTQDKFSYDYMNAREYANYYNSDKAKEKKEPNSNPAESVTIRGDPKLIVGYRFYHINAWPAAITGGRNTDWPSGEMAAICEGNTITRLPSGITKNKKPVPLAIHRLMYGDLLLNTEHQQGTTTEQTEEIRQQILCQTHLAGQTGCQCGIHAFYTPQRTRAIFARTTSFLLTQVTLFGQVISDQYGYRASHARIEAMWMMKDTEEYGPIDIFDEWMAFAFANRYGAQCEVADLANWDEFCKPLTPPVHPGLGIPWAESGYGIE